MSIIGYDDPGSDLTQLSPSIWGDCPNTLLNDKGLGYFADVVFLGAPTGTLAAALDVNMISFGNALKIDADTDTVLTQVADKRGGALRIETDGDDNDAAALFSQPFGDIVLNSGNRLWFEAIIGQTDISEDYGVFVGLAEADAVDGTTTTARDVISDGAASNAVVAESVLGFIRDNGDTDAFDIILKKDAGTAANPATNVTANAALPSADQASLTDNAYWRLGITFDGRNKIKYWVNGYVVATDTVDSTIDQAHDYCVVIGIKTGTATAEQLDVRRVRFGFQNKH